MVQFNLDRMRRLVKRVQLSYKQSLGAPVGVDALIDLARFCYASETIWHPDPHIRAMFEGRREVWLRIQKNLELNEKQVWDLYIQGLDTTQE